MESIKSRTKTVPVQLDNGTVIKIEVAQTGREDVALGIRSFKEVTDALEGIVDAISGTLQRTQPDKASVKLGLKLTTETGSLTTVIVKGSGEANLEITLEWGK